MPILSQINPILRTDTYYFKINSNISSNVRLGLPRDFFPAGVPVNILKAFLTPSIQAT